MANGKSKGGKSNKNRVKNVDKPENYRELTFAENSQVYGTVTALLGDCRLSVNYSDGAKRLAHIRGKLRNRGGFIKKDDVVLLGLREFQDEKCDVILKYSDDEVKSLRRFKELPAVKAVKEDGDGDDNKANDRDFDVVFDAGDDIDAI